MPRIVNTLKQAYSFRDLLESGEMESKAEIARKSALSRARVTQIMNLLKLHPRIQRKILDIPESNRVIRLSENRLRPLIALSQQKQLSRFRALIPGFQAEVTQR